MDKKKDKREKELTIKAKKWNLFDCFLLVFRAAPVYITLELILGWALAFIPSFQIFATADFVDTALGIIGGELDKDAIFKPLVNIFSVAIVPQILFAIEYFLDNCCYPRLTYLIEEAFLKKKASLKYEHIENSETHDLIGRASNGAGGTMVNRVWRLRNFLYIATHLVSVITVVFLQVWWSGLVALAAMIPAVWFAVKSGVEQYKAFSDTEKIERRATVYHTALRGKDYLEERSTFLYAPYVQERWYDNQTEADNINLKTSFRAGLRDNATWVLTWVMGLAIMVSLVPAVAMGNITSGMFVGITNGVILLVDLVCGSITWNIRWVVQSIKNLKDMTQFSCLSEEQGALDLPENRNARFESIEFKNVTFRYPGTERNILKNCSFTLKGGEHYAFVGVNGAGKTTITKLLTGLYDNYEGDIFINGKNLRDYTLAEKKGFFSVVHQDFAKYQIEFKENIKLGDVNRHDDGRLLAAIDEIGLGGVLSGLHSGLDTPLGKAFENGVDLSGGEWQRVAIARSLYSDAPMKILDEPTAALDPIAESGIYEMFRDVTKGESAIFITHRLGAAKIADKILVLDGGRVAEFGSHRELVALGGIYAEMFNTQKGWYED